MHKPAIMTIHIAQTLIKIRMMGPIHHLQTQMTRGQIKIPLIVLKKSDQKMMHP
jgi:hypothetical protein